MNNNEIKAAAPGTTLNDDLVRGLSLRSFAERKSFYLFYRTKGAVQRRPKIGDWPTITLAQARDIARDLLLEVARGNDPSADRQSDRTASTLADVWLLYKNDNLKLKSLPQYESHWRLYIEPRLGSTRVKEIGLQDCKDLHKSLSDHPYQANRVLATLSILLNYCEANGYRELRSNPVVHVARYPEKKRKRIIRQDEAPRLISALEARAEKEPAGVAFIYLLAFSGARKQDIANAKWEWLDGNVLRLPDSKTGEKVVYLPRQAMDVLERLPRTSGTITGIQSPKKLWHSARLEAGCPDLRIHDLRRTFISAGLMGGFTLDQMGKTIGHSSNQTTSGYAWMLEDAGLAVAQGTAERIEDLFKGGGK